MLCLGSGAGVHRRSPGRVGRHHQRGGREHSEARRPRCHLDSHQRPRQGGVIASSSLPPSSSLSYFVPFVSLGALSWLLFVFAPLVLLSEYIPNLVSVYFHLNSLCSEGHGSGEAAARTPRSQRQSGHQVSNLRRGQADHGRLKSYTRILSAWLLCL